MPVLTVLVPEHPALRTLLEAVADAVQSALGLAEGDVVVVHVPSGDVVLSGPREPQGLWPVVTMRGSDRGRSATDAALAAAETEVRAWARDNGVSLAGVWTEWTPAS